VTTRHWQAVLTGVGVVATSVAGLLIGRALSNASPTPVTT
jgi:hypothetical protein